MAQFCSVHIHAKNNEKDLFITVHHGFQFFSLFGECFEQIFIIFHHGFHIYYIVVHYFVIFSYFHHMSSCFQSFSLFCHCF